MKTDWNYTKLAEAYVSRPDYSNDVLDNFFEKINIPLNAKVCDVGAGVAHLTLPLLEKGFYVDAVEPNDEMRRIGISRTQSYSGVFWHEGTGEKTGMQDSFYDLVTFGSSFNVTNRSEALKETNRILKSNGWFCCLWNHRDLSNVHQKNVEQVIEKNIPGYNYGSRREDQMNVINESGLFGTVGHLEGKVNHKILKSDWVNAWRSHATLERQAGSNFEQVIRKIEQYILDIDQLNYIEVPYTTRLWFAQKEN